MGEHKFPKIVSEPNGDVHLKISTHIVVMVDVPTPDTESGEHQAIAIEAAYDALAKRAKSEDSFILNVVQTVNVYQTVSGTTIGSRLLVMITAQRISRAELEQQQLRQRMGMK